MKKLLLTAQLILFCFLLQAQSRIDSLMPVRGFCIGAPQASQLPDFLKFISQELVPRQVNTLILRIEYNYQYESHPELRDNSALSKVEVKQIVNLCKQHHIRLIPQINLLGHQSWASSLGNFLTKYPEFDETPHVKLPEKYVWPNPDGLYCKSYCPLHPGVHKIVFELVDEICEVFETDAFHAGMDEVFYIGDDKCSRCSGRDKAELFGGEVSKIQNHLSQKGRRLWIWGDRLLDGKTTGLGIWEASFNNTHRAIDLIPKEVVICDWHYDRPEQTAVYFAMKGFQVLTCPWRKPKNGVLQVKDMIKFRDYATPEMKDRYQGIIQTIWTDPNSFFAEFYNKAKKPEEEETSSNCFRSVFTEILQAVNPPQIEKTKTKSKTK